MKISARVRGEWLQVPCKNGKFLLLFLVENGKLLFLSTSFVMMDFVHCFWTVMKVTIIHVFFLLNVFKTLQSSVSSFKTARF